MRIGHLATALCPAVLVAACSLLPSSTGAVDVQYENTSTLAVTIRINGEIMGVIEPGSSGGMAVPARGFPWRIDAMSPGGRTLASMDLAAAPSCVPLGDGGTSCDGAVGLVDMVCGRFAMWASDLVPSFPAPVPGQGGPCGP
jgi:hypothetical protein